MGGYLRVGECVRFPITVAGSPDSGERMVGLDTQDIRWTLDHIRQHIEQGLPLVPLFNVDVIEASGERTPVRLREGEHVTRPGGSIAGPVQFTLVQFTLADVVTYALILAARHDE